ncbi:hypothetical protein SAMN05421810_101152 [Amycolatopsis arida]|uniref:CAAX prenyl protease 2/Lysostaphin resistance protein A-like domain-containing protein n=1 Tax=Amycolatopsis arida TaxID=587909 RepID=A0A1I5KHC7_9PSEU|nr:CPBP family intramembrane glutamic endopeptidase [Amycolatopsis arida]TDX97048.1 hypothetical protein CLV69_102150 [Amycolatopsis arida]SFO84445.1 hypothetical protein SAMN05421810_101152 [Amycolatopsis arida]
MVDDREDPPPSVRAATVLGAHWGLLAFFAGIGGYYLLTLVMAVVLAGHVDVGDPLQPRELGPVILLAFLPNLLLGLGPVVGSRLRGRGPRADFGLVPTARDVKVGLACGGFALLAGYLLNLLLLGTYGPERMFEGPLADLSSGLGDSLGWLVVAAVIVVLVAPVTEELLFRGALWNALDHHRVPPWAILLFTALVFAHLHDQPARTIALLGQGVAIGAARLITGRTGASVVAHAANNLPPALLLFAAP